MSTVAVVGGAIAIKKLVEQITIDLYANFKDGYKEKLDRSAALKNISTLHSKIEEVGKVKTIWQTDKAIQLSAFTVIAMYCTMESVR